MASVARTASIHMPTHHVHDELLMDYAAGACGEAESLLIATHLAMCPLCRDAVDELDIVGGTLLDDLSPMAMSDGSLDAILNRLDEDPTDHPAAPVAAPMCGDMTVPRPLRDYLDADLDALSWRPVMRGLEEYAVPIGTKASRTKLLRIGPGVAVPAHTHKGNELTLVLRGGFEDGRGHFLGGDVAITDSHIEHAPVADLGEPCVCLTVIDAPLKLTGKIGRLLNPFVRF